MTTSPTQRQPGLRMPAAEPRGILGKLVLWWSRRTYGDVLDPGFLYWHNRPVMFAVLGFERKVERWTALDPDLKTLATIGAAASIGCSWCLDFASFVGHGRGIPLETLREVPRWRESTAFTEVERAVLGYAEAMTATPPEVTDEQVAELTGLLGVTAMVELTMMVAVENQRSRFNSAMGLRSQGFRDRCGL